MIDLKAKPFYLNDENIKWVKDTLSAMTAEEKCGQLFCEVIWGEAREDADRIFENMQPGGVMFRSLRAEKVHKMAEYIQQKSQIPLLRVIAH